MVQIRMGIIVVAYHTDVVRIPRKPKLYVARAYASATFTASGQARLVVFIEKN